MENIKLNNMFMVFMMLVFLDIFTTQGLLSFFYGVELNTLIAQMMSVLGYFWWIPKLVVSYMIGEYLVMKKQDAVLKGIIVVMSIVCLINLFGIFTGLILF